MLERRIVVFSQPAGMKPHLSSIPLSSLIIWNLISWFHCHPSSSGISYHPSITWQWRTLRTNRFIKSCHRCEIKFYLIFYSSSKSSIRTNCGTNESNLSNINTMKIDFNHSFLLRVFHLFHLLSQLSLPRSFVEGTCRALDNGSYKIFSEYGQQSRSTML